MRKHGRGKDMGRWAGCSGAWLGSGDAPAPFARVSSSVESCGSVVASASPTKLKVAIFFGYFPVDVHVMYYVTLLDDSAPRCRACPSLPPACYILEEVKGRRG